MKRGESQVVRERLVGIAALSAALDGGRDVRIVLVADPSEREAPHSPELAALTGRVRELGIDIRHVSPTQLARLSGAGALGAAPDVLAMVGPDPRASLEEMLACRGAAWLLTGTAYPGNAGFAIRTAELSGADGIVIDAAFTHEQKRDVRRSAMRADRFVPVHYATAAETVAVARAAGRRIAALEDTGRLAPWETDLVAPTLFVVGGERAGIDPETLAQADVVLRLPMPGFMPSYNLQAAMAAVAVERLRQCEALDAT